ncbi:hypothetical protein PSHT_12885 [Puccinia striiformis]|uniref:non-specific serine/threonine protein kinase n=1 Tax=Puccinia striiformis TaxID=27350 RepID=A0A2S4UTW5_9BASI|nr:hypothetical protein PSHT_12885 [Puccinia striiformis]
MYQSTHPNTARRRTTTTQSASQPVRMSSETPATAALNQILNSKNEPSSPATKNSSTQRKAARYSLSLFNSSAAAASATALPLPPPPPQPQPQPKPIGGYSSLTRPDWNHSTSSNSTTTTTSSFITRNHHHHHQSQLSRSYSMATPPPLTTPQPQASASNSTPQSDPLLSRYTRASSSQPQPQPRNNNYLHPLSHLNQSSSSSSASSSSPSPATAATTTTTSTGNASSSSNITNNKERTNNPNQNGKNTSQLEAKVVILGMQGVGKTSIVHRYTTGSFSYSLTSTIGASFCTKKLSVDGCKVRLQIWDTAGQERFRSMAPMYYRGANAAILVYDITNKESFLDIQNWLNGEHFHLPFLPLAHNTNRPNVTKELRENMSTDLIIQVVGSKSDLGADKRTVNKEEAQAKLGQWTMGNVRTDMNGQMVLSSSSSTSDLGGGLPRPFFVNDDAFEWMDAHWHIGSIEDLFLVLSRRLVLRKSQIDSLRNQRSRDSILSNQPRTMLPKPTGSTSNSSRQLEIPDILPGGFTIAEEIGRGSFAVVYRGLNARTNQNVAIKAVIKSKLTNKLFQNLQDEINILKKIRHPNVVGLVDCVSNSDYIFLIMQYCSNGDLSVYIKSQSKKITKNSATLPFPHPQDGGLNEWIIRSFLGQLADALRFLRSHSIIHRDIKPQNLLLHPSSSSSSSDPDCPPHRYVPDGIPLLRVADFGFARVLAPNAGLAETLCGSPLYMAPEILRYEKYDAKADLWSVGAVLFEMAVGKPPFRAQNHVELLRKIEKSEDKIVFPDLKVVPEDLKILILSLLKRNPAERASFDQFFALADQVSRLGPLIPPPPPQQQEQQHLPPSIPLRPQLTTATPVQNLSLRPPSISTLPNPASSFKGKTHHHPPINLFDGEPGAFIIDQNSTFHNKSQHSPSSPSADYHRTPQNRQVSLNSTTTTTSFAHHHPGFQAPSPSILPSPLPSGSSTASNRQTGWIPSFPAKYIVPSSSSTTSNTTNRVTTPAVVKSKDYALMKSPSFSTSTSSSSSQQNNRRSSSSVVPPHLQHPTTTIANDNYIDDQDSLDRDLATEEYVVVEKGSVEINAMVDGLSSSPQKPMSLGRRMSRGFMATKKSTTTTLTGLASGSSPHRTTASPPRQSGGQMIYQGYQQQHITTSPVSSFPPRPHPITPSPIPSTTGTHPMNIANFGRSSPSSLPHYHNNPYPSSPRSFDSTGAGGAGIGSLPLVGKYFPQTASNHQSPAGLPTTTTTTTTSYSGNSPSSGNLSSNRPPFVFPSSTICRAILSSGPLSLHQNLASSSKSNVQQQQQQHSSSSPPTTSTFTSTTRNNYQHHLNQLDPIEIQLLSELEEFACKAIVIIDFADQKLAAILPPPPSASPSTRAGQSTTNHENHSGGGSSGNITLGAFVTTIPIDPSSSSSSPSEQQQQPHTRRRNTSTEEIHHPHINSSPSNNSAASKAVLASEALLFVMPSLSLIGKNYLNLGNPSPVTLAAIEWLRNKFNEVFDKTEFVKTKVKAKNYSIIIIIMVWSRTAAVNELVGDKLSECEIEYEGSLWMLYGLMDTSILHTDHLFDLSPDHPHLPSSSNHHRENVSSSKNHHQKTKFVDHLDHINELTTASEAR